MCWITCALQTMERGLFSVEALKFIVPTVISCIALFVALRDRRPKLSLKSRKGEWCKLKPAMSGGEIIFFGIVEVYNASARANAIRDYAFWCKRDKGWEKMDSERYRNSQSIGALDTICNKTPLSLAPYSGEEVHVMAFFKGPQPYEIQVKIEVEDLFGK